MEHADHVNLIKKGITKKGGVWADFGSGEGAFTLALYDLLGDVSEIYSIDQNNTKIATQKYLFAKLFPQAKINFLAVDFMSKLNLPKLDGIIMANSLHFFEDKVAVLNHLLQFLKNDGEFILVEYNVNTGNIWVPFPLSFESFKNLSKVVGLSEPQLLEKIPSDFLKEIYSAKAVKVM